MIHHPIRFEDYKMLEGVSNSTLKHIDRSPAHLVYESRKRSKPTEAMLLGSLADHLLFGTEFAYVVSPYDSWRTNEAKAWREEQNNAGIAVFKEDEVAAARTMVRTTKLHPAAAEIISEGRSQVGLTSDEEFDGVVVKVKGLLDFVSDSVLCIADYKTTEDASPVAYAKHAINMGYDVQAAIYTDLWYRNTGEAATFAWIVSESEPPHFTAVYLAPEEAIKRGREIYRHRLEKYAACMRENVWGAYPSEATPLELPLWALPRQ